MVFIPNEEENTLSIDFDQLTIQQKNRIYKIVSFTGNRLYAVPFNVAISIVDKFEYSLMNKVEFSMEKKSIKENCIKLHVDRLGNIKPVNLTSYPSASIDISTAKESTSPYFNKVSIGSMDDADQKILMHTSKMSYEERLAYLQKLREISHDPNLTEDEKSNNFKKIKINPPDENS